MIEEMERLASEHMAGGMYGIRGDITRMAEIRYNQVGWTFQ